MHLISSAERYTKVQEQGIYRLQYHISHWMENLRRPNTQTQEIIGHTKTLLKCDSFQIQESPLKMFKDSKTKKFLFLLFAIPAFYEHLVLP